MVDIVINIAEEFSKTPGARNRVEGQFSAEEFLDTLLVGKFQDALNNGIKLIVLLDGTAGYATSFLEGAFGELVRRFSKKAVKSTIQFISNEEPYLIDEINQYIDNA
jgi:hypothetical protein